jgi:cytochrome c oxidase subunit II
VRNVSITLATLCVKQDVTPGLPVSTCFTPIATGSREVGCSQLCGPGHSRMRARFEVRSEAEWQAFVADEVSRLEPPS